MQAILMKMVISFLLILTLNSPVLAQDVLTIGFNLPMSGENKQTGISARDAAEMIKERINLQGGLTIGSKSYILKFIYEDNDFDPKKAQSVTQKLVETDKALAIVGPMASRQAVPAGAIANKLQTPMISPWSTNPKTTLNRPWVFRAAFLDPFQSDVAIKFSEKLFKPQKVAVIFVKDDDYSKDLAELFKLKWEHKYGTGTVVGFEGFLTGNNDFTPLVKKILKDKPDLIFLPCHYYQTANIMKTLHTLGWEGPIMGTDSWNSADLFKLCGRDCVGHFFSTHYTALGAKGLTQNFVQQFQRKYNYLPDDPAALTYDSINLIFQALKNSGDLFNQADSITKKRAILRFALSKIQQFNGVTGKMSFNYQGDPIKCAVVVKINEKGEFVFSESVCPEE
ncbi:MAG: branched-chain amino acid transport system substrate-binding protein [Desulfonauticus sp.]|nr:branched-chain amino acid transport system substrate-binding protein [Desulfonauticus sp.]